VGGFETLTATVTPSNATNQNVTWTSSASSVATVTNGVVVGVAVGSAVVTVTTSDGNKTAACSVTVSPISVTGVTLNKASTSLTVGGTETLSATVAPSNATNKNVTWSSSATSVATVSASGVVSAVAAGSAIITVRTEDGGKTATCTVSVSAPTASVTFNANSGSGTVPTAQTVSIGSNITLPNGTGLSRSGYTFGGWNTNTSGTGTAYKAGDSYTVTGNVTLYAKWDTNYTVTYNVNGGSGTAPTSQTAINGSIITLSNGSGLTRSGYTFGGWNTNTSGTGTAYKAGDSYTVTGNVTLYAKWDIATLVSVSGIANQLSWLKTNAASGGNYTLEVNADESIGPQALSYSGKSNITIRLKGIGSMRTITLSANGSMFSVNSGVTLILDENITLVGRSSNNASLVSVSGGNLIMNDGSKITGNTYSSNSYSTDGGGVYINSGTFTMNGGEITGNTVSCTSSSYSGHGGGVYINSGTFNMYSGTISGNTSSDGGGGICIIGGTASIFGGVISGNEGKSKYGGGGIFVFMGGTLTMYGGKISGNTSGRFGGGVYVYSSSRNPIFTMYGGVINGNTAKEGGGGVDASYGTFKKLPPIGGQNSGFIYGSEAVGVDADGIPLKNTSSNSRGHAIDGSSSRYRNTTVGEADQIDTTTGRGLSANGSPPFGQ
jgi:uncharacterized repeat protein (TIGR02543 family)